MVGYNLSALRNRPGKRLWINERCRRFDLLAVYRVPLLD
jgi:hypothetical protein